VEVHSENSREPSQHQLPAAAPTRESTKQSKAFEGEEAESEVVMVELDEEFVVEQVEPSHQAHLTKVVGERVKPSHRCVLCGRKFRHYMNLQVHLTGHVGVKVNINRCAVCRRNFRNAHELQLHKRAHSAARLLGKIRPRLASRADISELKAKVISTAGGKDKKIIRKYMKKPNPVLVKSASKPESAGAGKPGPQKNGNNGLTCGMCDRSFGVKSLFLRHIKKNHPELSQTLESHSKLKTLPSVNIKKCSVPRSPGLPLTPTINLVSDSDTASVTSTPVSRGTGRGRAAPAAACQAGLRKERTKSDSLVPELPDYYNTLECPDCGKSFVAKSIFERHLQSAKHGLYSINMSWDSDAVGSPRLGLGSPGLASPRTPVPSLLPGPAPGPHWTESPLSLTGSPHRIECHLCGQSFVRVKDLAKHREKMCQAYHSGRQ